MNVYWPETVLAEIREAAWRRRMSMSELIRQAVVKDLENEQAGDASTSPANS